MPILDKPLIILGAARSGTHLLASTINLHDDVAYYAEPSYVWKYSNAWMGHDMIPAARATPEVRHYIRSTFERYCNERGKQRFCEKTPGNTLRLPFVMRVLPAARVVHIVRHGRDVSTSTIKKYRGDLQKISRQQTGAPPAPKTAAFSYDNLSRVMERVRYRLGTGVPARDFVYYLPFFLSAGTTMLGMKRKFVWGPRLPGMRQLFKSHSDLEVAVIQWRTCVESVLNYRANHPEMAYFEVKYEDLCQDPVVMTKNIYRFCELDFTAEIERKVRAKFAGSSTVSTLRVSLAPEEEQMISDQIAHTLEMLGYDQVPGRASPEPQEATA